MGDATRIEWADATWNPVTGCTPVSAGCANCYAAVMAKRLQAMGAARYKDGFRVTLHQNADVLGQPSRWKRPRRIFVCSMSDLFHPEVPFEFVLDVWREMAANPRHTFLVLTKRPERLREFSKKWLLQPPLAAPTNVWLGTTVESREHLGRLDSLRGIPAAGLFVSFEPLLGPMNLQRGDNILWGIQHAIVGGESGPNARPMDAAWVREIRDECQRTGTAFMFKQWGGVNKKAAGRLLDGREWLEFPGVHP